MKRLALTLVICLGCMGILRAQNNIWKPITCDTPLLGAASNGDLFAMAGYSGLLRSQNEGETWEQVNGNYMHQCIAFSPQGRIFVSPASYTYLLYSDDGGDTWQQTTIMSSCAMNDIGGIYAVSNDIVVVWSLNGEMYYTLDGGMTWGFGGIEIDEYHQVGDLIVNEAGDVYASKWYYSGEDSGIFHSSLSDMQNWELVAFDGAAIHQMEFDPDGNIVAGALWGSLGGFQHEPGFYLIDGQTIAVSDNGIVYHLRYNYSDYTAVLNYSTDHGEHFFDIGEALPTDNPAPGGGSGASIFKGHDNHLYFHGNGQYYKSVRDADHIDNYHPVVEDGKQWNVLFSYPWNPPEPQHKYTDIYKIEGDTLLDGVSYKVMYTTRNENLTGWSVCGVIRETEDKQVLYRRDGSSYDEILYDFSMEVGDTIIMNGNGFYPDMMFVIETNEILVNGEPRQQIVLEYPWGDQEVWIEGIGSLYGVINSGSLFLMGGSTDLLCYYEDGDLIWQNTTPGYNECYIVNSGQQGNLAVTPDTLWFDEMYYYEKTFIINNPTDQPVTITDISADNQFVGGYYTDNHPLVGIYYWDNSIGRLCPMEEVLPITLQANGGIELIVELYVVQPWAKRDEFINVPINIVSTAGHDVVTLMIGKEATSFGLVAYPPYIQLDYYNSAPFTVVSSEWDQPIIITGIEEVGTNYLEIIPDSPLPVTLQNYGDFLSGSVRVRDGIHEFFETEIRISSSVGNAYIGVDNSLGFMAPIGNEWYYEIQNENGSITYQYMYQAGDTIVNDEPTHILVKINTLYDKGIHTEETHEYVYERDGKLYWWNKTLEEFTVLYDFGAEEGDSWVIKVGTETLTMHVDAVEYIEYEGRTYRMLHVSDPDDLFSGDIVCGIGHLTSFFPERLMDNGDGIRVEGMRCYWVENELVFKYGDEDCDAIYDELHGVEENVENQFNVFPNPTNGVLFIETHSRASLPNPIYRITNLMGQTLLTGQITADTRQINVAGLSEGMYFITFAGETRKFVVR